MIDEEGQIKLIDFGIAAPALVAGHEILGSPGHMAPEQVDGGELGPSTDIFAVAVLLMEAWTGSAPFRRATPEECAAAVTEPHPRPSDFDPRLLPLDEAIGRAMQVDPRARQQEASELARSLRMFLQGVDVADIARALGDRVRDLRIAHSEPAPVSADAPRGATASVGDLGTKTFAARDEALRWSAPPDSMEGVAAPSTRRLEEAQPREARPVRGRRDDPAMAIATPLMVEGEELEKIHADIAAARKERTATVDEATPVSALRTAPPPPEKPSLRPPSPRFRGLALAFVAVVSMLAFGAWWRTRSRPSEVPTSSPVLSAVRTSAPIEDQPAAPPSAAPSAAESAAPSPVPKASVTSSASPTVGKAAITLLGEPGTRVVIDGSARGPCPVRTTVPEGAHDIRFVFDPTGESRGERLNVRAGEAVTVRAEFTRATPTITILR